MRNVLTGAFIALAILTFGLLQAPLVAQAGGDPGGSPPVGLSLDGFALSTDGAVIFDGTLACAEALDVTVTMVVQQGPDQHALSVYRLAKLTCSAQTATPIRLDFTPAFPGRYHPGTITVGIEVDACTVPDGQGNTTCHNLWGIVERQLGPAGGR